MRPFWRWKVSRKFYWKRGGENGWGKMKLGRWGEARAADYLRAQGAKVLYCNFRGPHGGEVDIIVRDGQQLCFVEVKTRRYSHTSRPLDAVNQHKQELIERGARAWIKMLHDREILWRFDVLEVELMDARPPKMTWVKQAFAGQCSL